MRIYTNVNLPASAAPERLVFNVARDRVNIGLHESGVWRTESSGSEQFAIRVATRRPEYRSNSLRNPSTDINISETILPITDNGQFRNDSFVSTHF